MDGEPNEPTGVRSSNLVVRGFRRLSDLAVVSGLYTAGSVASAYLLVGEPIDRSVVWASGVCAVGLYLVDRVKLRDRDLDPADLAAMPERHTFLRRHAVPLRVGSVGLFTVSSALFARHHPWLAALPPLGLLAVVIYSLGPRHGTRPKDQLLIKNGMVAAAVVGLAGAVLWASGVGPFAQPSLVVFAWLGLIVFGDAALSDLDDSRTDRQFQTQTIPNAVGHRRTWAIALLAQMGAALIVCGLAPSGVAVWCLGLGVPLTTLGLWALRLAKVRDPIDLRLPMLAGATLLIQSLN